MERNDIFSAFLVIMVMTSGVQIQKEKLSSRIDLKGSFFFDVMQDSFMLGTESQRGIALSRYRNSLFVCRGWP